MTLLAPWLHLQAALDFCRISTWSVWLWSLSETKVLPLLPVTTSKASFAVWKIAFFRDRSWLFHFFLFLYVWTAFHNLQKVYQRKQSNIIALLWKLEGLWGDFKSMHAYTFCVFSDLEAEAKSNYDVMAAFYLSNREAQRELNVYRSDRFLPFGPTSTCLLVKWTDRSHSLAI